MERRKCPFSLQYPSVAFSFSPKPLISHLDNHARQHPQRAHLNSSLPLELSDLYRNPGTAQDFYIWNGSYNSCYAKAAGPLVPFLVLLFLEQGGSQVL